MTTVAEEAATVTNCPSCARTSDECFAAREDCCSDCGHYPNVADLGEDVDPVAVERAIAGDKSAPLNRAEMTEAHRRLAADGYSQNQAADRLGVTARSVDRIRNGHTAKAYSRQGATMTDDTAALLRRAMQSESKRIQSAARKAQTAIEQVRALLADDEGKAEVRRKVERLERELREAKAALRGGSTPVAAAASTGPVVCANGCGRTFRDRRGIGPHERSCSGAA